MFSVLTFGSLSGHQLLCCLSGSSSDISPTLNTVSLPLLFHSHCPIWLRDFLFMTNPLLFGPHPPLFLHMYPLHSLTTLLPTSATFPFLCLSSFCPFPLFFLPHVQPFTVQPHSPRLASFPSCSRCAQMDKGMNLVSCSTRTPRE